MLKRVFVGAIALGLVVVVASVTASAVKAASGGGGYACPDIYAPVICSNGQIYPNACYASLAKAKNCHPWGNN
jgi:hypothetical protein